MIEHSRNLPGFACAGVDYMPVCSCNGMTYCTNVDAGIRGLLGLITTDAEDDAGRRGRQASRGRSCYPRPSGVQFISADPCLRAIPHFLRVRGKILPFAQAAHAPPRLRISPLHVRIEGLCGDIRLLAGNPHRRMATETWVYQPLAARYAGR
jgi:hypothetical protein